MEELARWESKIMKLGTGHVVVIPAEHTDKLALDSGDIIEMTLVRIVERGKKK